MPPQLKPLSEQVIVITGASSGVGLATARRAAEAGAGVVLAARNETALRQVCEEINGAGGRAHAVAGDVGDPADVAKIARAAVARFGRFDTWINDAGVGLYGDLEATPPEDHERLFRTNYFGVVNGSLEAVRQLKAQPGGGAIINVGSALSEVAMPQMGAYAASKQAVKGFTDALRLELRRERAPISVTLIKPAGVASPFAEHARNLLDHAARLPPPLYAPEVVADAILHAAQHPVRELLIGAGGGSFGLAGHTPRVAERVFGGLAPRLSRRKGPKPAADSLHAPGQDGRISSEGARGRRFSVYTKMQEHPGLALGVGALVVAGLAAYFGRGAIARSARPVAARLARPMAHRALRHRPLQAMRLAATHPRQAAKLAAALR
ncbi:MAG: SDR family oxidoreductase [Phenylobacterium sp.]|uniref:SDR family oxidoreductase n=1 Tax=Phenylobacterium sp. TaxID=1871053 RepID=UPI003918EF34